MTLRDECEAFMVEESLKQYDEYTGQEKAASNNALRDALERLCLKQQAVGLREAATIAQTHNDDYIAQQCEQRARECEQP